jgi:N-acetylmuramic acid 6-phosphate etherase
VTLPASRKDIELTTPPPLPTTEKRHPATSALDEMSSVEILTLLNAEDAVAVAAVQRVLPALATLVDETVARLRAGGSVHYFGAGTSGRLGFLDAAELRPTFNLPAGVVTAHIAGGAAAIVDSIENAEDSVADGEREAGRLGEHDVAVGLTASGSTPYVGGALRAARAAGAYTALITSNQASPLEPLADCVIAPDTGSEVLTGSTRLKAGTAEKIVLNGFSTSVMVRMGRTYSNLMVSLIATNQKLKERTLRILGEVSDADDDRNAEILSAADGDLKVAMVSLLGPASMEEARRALELAQGSVRAALRALPRLRSTGR